jgi:hypothetical protein
LTDVVIVCCYIYLYLQVKKQYKNLRMERNISAEEDLEMRGNLKSLMVLFLSICLVYSLREVQYIIEIFVSQNDADKLDPFILVAKTILILGIFTSIYMRI